MYDLVETLLEGAWKDDAEARRSLAARLLAESGSKLRPASPRFEESFLFGGGGYPAFDSGKQSNLPSWAIAGAENALPFLWELLTEAPEMFRFLFAVGAMFGTLRMDTGTAGEGKPNRNYRFNCTDNELEYAVSLVVDRFARTCRFACAFEGSWRWRLARDYGWDAKALDDLGAAWIPAAASFVLNGDRPYRSEAALEIIEPVVFGRLNDPEVEDYASEHFQIALGRARDLLETGIVDIDTVTRLKVLSPDWIQSA